MTEIVALISTYKEEEILDSAIESVQCLDATIIFDGPTNEPRGDISLVYTFDEGTEIKFSGGWESDAKKRTEMLLYAQSAFPDAWALWLDGDEVLLWGEYLKDHCRRAEEETATGGTTLRIVEYDGSVAQCYGKLIRLDAVKRYVMSSYEVELSSGLTVALPNVPICYAGGLPYGDITDVTNPLLGLNRPPLQGEPHLLHRHGLRSPKRTVERLHNTEAESFQTLVRQAGLEGVDKPKTVEGV